MLIRATWVQNSLRSRRDAQGERVVKTYQEAAQPNKHATVFRNAFLSRLGLKHSPLDSCDTK
jgi:hypothetical protein